MSELTVEVEIPPALLKALGVDLQKQVIQPATYAWAQQVKRVLVKYPPENIGNRPNLGRWYERGYGPRWKRRDGTIGGRKTSERLKRSWTVEREVNGAIVGSIASYSRWVHSKEFQTRVHARHGWKTDEQAVNEARPAMDRIMSQIMTRLGL